MLLSLDWVSDFVDLSGITHADIAEELTVHTAEVEGVAAVTRAVNGIVVGRVLTIEPLGEPGKPPVAATVDVGGRTVATVCGASNIAVGAVVAVALPGAKKADGSVVSEATVHGRASAAVLCSPAELGWSDAHDGLLLLPSDVKPGTPLANLISATDTLIEIDNKSLTHRPDLWGQYGFARELAAIFNRPLRDYATRDLAAYDKLPAFTVEVESAADCPYYSAIKMDVAPSRPSPARMQSRLHAIGARSRNLLVDVTNYVSFELGQPTHAFDGDKVTRIRVARAGVERDFATLDGKTWKLPADALLINDGATPLALAGIMGGRDTEVTPETRSVLLESANFRGSRVRTTSARLGLRTDASLRFEKKLPPVFCRIATGRILELFAQANYEYKPVTRFSAVGDPCDRPRTIAIAPGYLARRAGADISDETATTILRSIGFNCTPAGDKLTVTVPPFRSVHDISIPEDISEEVMRLYGYDNIKPQLPAAAIDSVLPNVPLRNHHRYRRVLAQAHEFAEVDTYGWYDEKWLTEIGYTPLKPTLELANALAANRMRESLVPNLLAVVHTNRKWAQRIRVFEIGKVFWLDDAGQKQEENELAGIAAEQTSKDIGAEFRALRGVLDDLATAAGIGPLTYTATKPTAAPWTCTTATAEIRAGDRVIGTMGVLPLALRKKVADAGVGVWFALRVDQMTGPLYPTFASRPIPVYPGSFQDFTIIAPSTIGYAGLDALLAGLAHPLLESRTFIGVYTPPNAAESNYTFRFQIRHPEHTITADEIESFREAVRALVSANGLRDMS
jgi:phenylalanyl-tRNA synthetase beta chain